MNENIFFYEISYKTLIDPKPLDVKPYKVDRFIRVYDGRKYLTLFSLKNIMPCTTGLDIL